MDFLNLPTAGCNVKTINGRKYIFDPFRKKFVSLTPEEWVRQHFVAYLLTRGYPAGLIGNEVSLLLNNRKFRCDTVVYDKQGEPLVIAEYKAPSVELTRSVFEQAANYNIALRVKYLIISNGLSHHCCRVNYDAMQFEFLHEIPTYAML